MTMSIQEKIQKAVRTAARLQALSQEDGARREELLSLSYLLTADADKLIEELVGIDARRVLYSQVVRLHHSYQQEFQAGVKQAIT